MLIASLSWAQSLLAGDMAAALDGSLDTLLAGLMTLGFAAVFAGWVIFVVIRGLARTRHEKARSHAWDFHTMTLEGLGTTMADGGEPAAPEEHESRGRAS